MIILYKQVCDNDRSFIGTQPARRERRREKLATVGVEPRVSDCGRHNHWATKPPQQPALPILLSYCPGGTAEPQSHTGKTTQLCGFKCVDID